LKKLKVPLIALIGPTAVGKTEISLQLAQKLPCEIVSCDSMQIYKGMDIGTGKPSTQEREQVPHHMLDLIPPSEPFSAAEFARRADNCLKGITSRKKIPLLVGGSGLYFDALVYGLSEMPSADSKVRTKLKELAQDKGNLYLYQNLEKVDPDYASKIHVNDLKRIIRALEVYELTGQPFSQMQKTNKQKDKGYETLLVGLDRERSKLYERIEQRVEKMFAQGLVEEVRGLRERGYDLGLPAFQALGYKETIGYLQGDLTLEKCIAQIKKNTKNFAKRQLTYFRKNKDIHWFKLDEEKDSLFTCINNFCSGTLPV